MKTNRSRVVLGIDPGTALCGYGIVEEKGDGFTALDYGCVETSKEEPMPRRLDGIFRELTQLVEIYRPSVMCVEKLFF